MQSTVRPILSRVCDANVGSTLGAVQGIRHLPSALQEQVISGFVKGFRNVWISLLPFAIVGLLTCLLLRTIKLHTKVDEQYYALADRHRFTMDQNGRRVVDEERPGESKDTLPKV